MKRWVRIGVICILSSIAAQTVYGQIPTVTVTPVTKSIALSKGSSESGTFVAFNNSEEPMTVKIEPRYWYMVEENRDIPIDSWLKISPMEFELGPLEKREVAFTATAPENAVGELAAMIAFVPKRKEGQPINVVFSVSLYLMIKETEKVDCKLSNFRLWKFEEVNSYGVQIDLTNMGNTHLRPQIMVDIKNIFNNLLRKAAMQYGMPAYPGKTQEYNGAIYNFILKPGLYKADIDIEYTNLGARYRRKVYFIAGRDGKILFTFFRRHK